MKNKFSKISFFILENKIDFLDIFYKKLILKEKILKKIVFYYKKIKYCLDIFNFIFNKKILKEYYALYSNYISDCDFLIIPFFINDIFFDKKISLIKNGIYFDKIIFLLEDKSFLFNTNIKRFTKDNNFIFFKKTINIKKILKKITENKKLIKQNNINNKIMLVGKTNVGKSSICNFLIRKYKFVISKFENFTRSFLFETCKNLQIFDSPGFTKRKFFKVKSIDLFVFTIDLTFNKKDEKIFNFFKKTNTKIIICLNKIDITKKETIIYFKKKFNNFIFLTCSCLKKIGFSNIINAINFCLKKKINKLENFVSMFLNKKTKLYKNIILVFTKKTISKLKLKELKRKIYLKFNIKEGMYFLKVLKIITYGRN